MLKKRDVSLKFLEPLESFSSRDCPWQGVPKARVRERDIQLTYIVYNKYHNYLYTLILTNSLDGGTSR